MSIVTYCEEAQISKVEHANLSGRAYAAIREGLIRGRFRPGEHLVIRELAAQLGTSITPVREACQRLVSENALMLKSRRFAIVPPMTEARYLEVRTIRLELEGLAVELAAAQAGPSDIEALEALQSDYEIADHAGDAEKAFALNRQFHFAVYRLCALEMLVGLIGNLWVSMGPMLTVFYRDGAQTYVGGAEHRAVIRALATGDGEEARNAMRRDLLAGGTDLLRFLRRQGPYGAGDQGAVPPPPPED